MKRLMKQFDEDKLYKKLEKNQKKLEKMVAKGKASIADQPFANESLVMENDPVKVLWLTFASMENQALEKLKARRNACSF